MLEQRVGEARRHAEARGHVFREPRVEGGREGETLSQAMAPCRQAERTLGRDVDVIGVGLVDQTRDGAPRQ